MHIITDSRSFQGLFNLKFRFRRTQKAKLANKIKNIFDFGEGWVKFKKNKESPI